VINRFEIVQGLYSYETRLSNAYLQSVLRPSSVAFQDTGTFLNGLKNDAEHLNLTLLSGDSLSFMRDLQNDDAVLDKFRPNIIVTDPPYSFNVVEGDDNEMQALFRDLVSFIPKLIAPRGVASIVVPSFSRNGQSIPFYQSNEVFTRRMLAACAKVGRELLFVSESFPDSATFPKLPYNWNSQRGVSRHIMNFLIE
jgi:tRNA G10  N-methylase Trm11